jgi:hypothetical protein
MNLDLSTIPVGVLVALAVLGILQVVLDVIALVDLYRRPAAQVVFANKWIWLAVILLVNTIGPILYLAVARKPAVRADSAAPPEPASGRAERVADSLYGARDDTDRK